MKGGPAMRRAEDTGELATAATPQATAATPQAAGGLATDLVAAERPLRPSRYRNPGDVIGLVAGTALLAAAVIA